LYYFNHKILSIIIISFFTISLFTTSVEADDPEFITIAGGLFDFNRKKNDGGEFRLEYRSNQKFLGLKPFATSAIATNGMTFLGGGVLLDVFFGRRLVLTPSFAPTLWFGETDKLDLGHVVEFRSQLEAAYRFDDRSRLGLSVSHYSNASLGDKNPGTESFLINYSIPFRSVTKLF